ncbi:MAG: hypothetical protein ACKVOU_07120, partial [Cytophagales bacterium]
MRIFYFSPDHNAPSGGIKVIYNHATILRENGFEAFILHSKKGFKSTWFENKCPLKYLSEISFLPTDIVVIPEIFFHLAANPELNLKDRIRNFRGKKTDYYGAKFIWQSVAKKIVFNQNAYHTFLDFSTKYPLNYHLFDIP